MAVFRKQRKVSAAHRARIGEAQPWGGRRDRRTERVTRRRFARSGKLPGLSAISGGHSYGTWEFEARGPVSAYPKNEVTELRVLVTVDGEPCARLRMPHPGPEADEAYLNATIRRRAQPWLDRQAALEQVRARLDSRSPRLRRDLPHFGDRLHPSATRRCRDPTSGSASSRSSAVGNDHRG